MYCDIIPLGRMATSEDSAKVIAFLCSPLAGFINGQNIYVDGGLSLVWPETLARKLTAL
jgi:NAD(P)-dependent dehydrogenase (short-subunit alcohol dehydrogenase family)